MGNCIIALGSARKLGYFAAIHFWVAMGQILCSCFSRDSSDSESTHSDSESYSEMPGFGLDPPLDSDSETSYSDMPGLITPPDDMIEQIHFAQAASFHQTSMSIFRRQPMLFLGIADDPHVRMNGRRFDVFNGCPTSTWDDEAPARLFDPHGMFFRINEVD